MLEMIIAQSSHEHSLILDCFAGSGSTLRAAQKLKRCWIGIDHSDVAIQTIRETLKQASYQFIDLIQS